MLTSICFVLYRFPFLNFSFKKIGNFERKMTKYNTFLTVFIFTIVAMVLFTIFYMQAIFGFVYHAQQMAMDHYQPNPFSIFSRIFTPGVVITFIVMMLCSLTYRILGIVHVARTKTISDGEKALWIVGFILMGFIAGIVFLVMAKGKKMFA